MVTDNGGEGGFFAANAEGRLVCFDGEDWWALLPTGLWCVGGERSSFVVINEPAAVKSECRRSARARTSSIHA